MKTTARLIVTYHCNRSCPGCCNTHDNSVRNIEDVRELLNYDEIVITGGEPMLLGYKLLDFIKKLREIGYTGKIYMYTAWWSKKHYDIHILKQLNGITFTLHAELNHEDIVTLKELTEILWDIDSLNNRLFIDERVWDKLSLLENSKMCVWNEIRKLEWKDECEPAEHEELLTYLL